MSGEQATWEYRTGTELAPGELDELGRTGWELVSVENRTFYLKRPRLTFRERVTLEQRERYFAHRDHGSHAEGAAS
jgi:hypothetical protein